MAGLGKFSNGCILLVDWPLENWRHFENLSSDYLTSFGCRFGSFIHQLCITVMDSRSASPLAPIILGYFGHFVSKPNYNPKKLQFYRWQ